MLNIISGPKGFTVFDGIGLLVIGFEHRPAFGLPYNLRMDFPENIHKAAGLLQKRRSLVVSCFH